MRPCSMPRKVQRWLSLLLLCLRVTNHCNLGCITCPREYDYGKAMDKGTIQFEKMMKVIDEVAPYVDSIGPNGPW